MLRAQNFRACKAEAASDYENMIAADMGGTQYQPHENLRKHSTFVDVSLPMAVAVEQITWV